MKKVVFLFLFFSLSVSLFAQSPQQDQIQQLQNEINQLKLRLTRDSIIKATLNQAIEYQAALEKFKSDIIVQNRRIEIMSYILGSVTLLAVLAALYQFFFGFNKQVKNLIDSKIKEFEKNLIDSKINEFEKSVNNEINKVAEQFKDRLNEYIEEFRQVMEERKRLNQAFKNTHITAVVDNDTRRAVLENFFLKIPRFRKPDFIIAGELVEDLVELYNKLAQQSQQPTAQQLADAYRQTFLEKFRLFDQQTNIVIFDDTEQNNTPRAIAKDALFKLILDTTANDRRMYLFYGLRQTPILYDEKYREITSAANKRTTLYARLKETIEYQSDLLST